MPSPFPGMDPFIEGQLWQDFHTSFITVLREQLVPQVRPRYVVQIEEGSATAATLAPALHISPIPRQDRQKFLSIRSTQSRRIVSVIELLSPVNKTPGD